MDEKVKTVPAAGAAERFGRIKRMLNVNFSESGMELSVIYAGFHQQDHRKSVQDG